MLPILPMLRFSCVLLSPPVVTSFFGLMPGSYAFVQYDSLSRRVGKQSEIKGQSDQKRFLWAANAARGKPRAEQPVPLRARQLCAARPS
ncbi:hypothetical protein ALQ32_200126 [Pseudomonas syringae pv. tagetis]|uniref:Uncharacterized protein n=1 Tax=Pseudomonas syringae pv. tagetis TaxID=129140 RepID=A0A3M3YTJ2_9PSED|nr:hypothetical protein ALQ32_200126 [Pseudomonas syringae pv. tagetis]RMU95937.1 hypothetical protein ALP19_200247 [Pseudomonas syringae pv. tomato]